MRLQQDKKLHIAACFGAGIFVLVLAWLAAHVGPWVACLTGGSALAVAYELLQKYRGEGEPSMWDALAGVGGAAAAAALVYASGWQM